MPTNGAGPKTAHQRLSRGCAWNAEWNHRKAFATPLRIAQLGGGWVAEEALTPGLWFALAARSFEEGVITAMKLDSYSTGGTGDRDAPTGNSAWCFGDACWVVRAMDLCKVIAQIAEDMRRSPRN